MDGMGWIGMGWDGDQGIQIESRPGSGTRLDCALTDDISLLYSIPCM